MTVHNIRAIVHGADGLGGIAHDYTPCDKSLQPGHAVTKMIELVNKYPGIQLASCIVFFYHL